MVDDDGKAQIADFGLATIESVRTVDACSMSNSGGNTYWLAPELMDPKQFDGTGKTTRESDVYAFGMTALEVCDWS